MAVYPTNSLEYLDIWMACGKIGAILQNLNWRLTSIERKYFYNPLVKKYPQLATWAEPFTGEPPEVAKALAQILPEHNLKGWVLAYPFAAMNGTTVVIGVLMGLLSWGWRFRGCCFCC